MKKLLSVVGFVLAMAILTLAGSAPNGSWVYVSTNQQVVAFTNATAGYMAVQNLHVNYRPSSACTTMVDHVRSGVAAGTNFIVVSITNRLYTFTNSIVAGQTNLLFDLTRDGTIWLKPSDIIRMYSSPCGTNVLYLDVVEDRP